jgi:thioredoxin
MMKKLSTLFAFMLSITLISCSNVIGSNEGEEIKTTTQPAMEEENSQGELKPEYLTYDTFLEKVWNFEENPQEWVYEGEVPCVIDFYADWCRPCRMVAPIMDDLAKEYDGKLKIYKIDVDKEKRLASVFQVRSIPAVLFSPMEGRPMMQAGALPKDQYIKIIEENLLTESK